MSFDWSSPLAIGKITVDTKKDRKETEEEHRIDEILNQSKWVKQEEPVVKKSTGFSFDELIAQEEKKDKVEAEREARVSYEPPINADYYPEGRYQRQNGGYRRQRNEEPEYGSMVYYPETGEEVYVPDNDGGYEDNYRGYGNRQQGYYNDRRNYGGRGGRYGDNGGVSGNQFYDNGEDNEQRNDRRYNKRNNGQRKWNSEPRAPKLSALEKYGDYSKGKSKGSEEGEQKSIPVSTHKIELGSKRAPAPPPPRLQTTTVFRPAKIEPRIEKIEKPVKVGPKIEKIEQVEIEKPKQEKVEEAESPKEEKVENPKEEEWNPED